ncbi:MAG: oligosaccharide flippase family protein [Anaerolineaceae bacterium]|nr:oligosaccharide flippase family protein [Anaerolineaceae bacterium]
MIQAKNKESKLTEARQRLPLNMISNITWFVLNIIVGIWYTPYLIANLGVAVYGLVPLVSSLTNYLSLITDGFNSAASRFLQIELAKDDTKAANRFFNTSVAGALTIFALIIPIAILVSSFALKIFDVPLGHEQDAQWLVLLTMLSFGLTFFSSSFAISSFANHRFDLRLVLNIVRLIAQMGLLVILFSVLSPQLWQVGIGIFISALFYLLGHYLLCQRLTPFLKIKLKIFDFASLVQMLKFSGWVLVNQSGALLFLSIDLIVANLVFGATVAGRYGAVLIFSALLRSLVGTISAVFDPIVFTLFGQNNYSGLARFSKMTIKFMGLFVALPIGLIGGLAKPILIVWLGPEYSDLSWLVVVLVSHLCINLAVLPLFPVQVSTNHVRVPGLMTLFAGLTNAALAVALALWSGWGYISIAISGAIVLTAKNGIFTPLYNARILHLPWWTFVSSIAASVLAWFGVFLVSFWVSKNFVLTNLLQISLAGAVIGGLYLLVVFVIGLSAYERNFIKEEIHKRFGRYRF